MQRCFPVILQAAERLCILSAIVRSRRCGAWRLVNRIFGNDRSRLFPFSSLAHARCMAVDTSYVKEYLLSTNVEMGE